MPSFRMIILVKSYIADFQAPVFSVASLVESITQVLCNKMPKQIKEIQNFLFTARRADAKSVKIKKNKDR